MTKSVIETPLRSYQKMSGSKVLRKVIDVESTIFCQLFSWPNLSVIQ